MVCATAFLDAQRVQAQPARPQRAGAESEKTIRVNDEAWRALPIAGLGEYYQAAFKLGRQTGVQHWMVLHRLSDLDAAGDAGTRQQALAKGLLAETGTVIVYRQHPEEARRATPILGLSGTEAQRIAHYPQGVALWRIGGRSYEVRHVRSAARADTHRDRRRDGASASSRAPRAPSGSRRGWERRRERATDAPERRTRSGRPTADRALPVGRDRAARGRRLLIAWASRRPTRARAARFASRAELAELRVRGPQPGGSRSACTTATRSPPSHAPR